VRRRLTVMDDPSTDPGDPEPEPLWLKLPTELAPFFDLGFVHSEAECPMIVFRAVSDHGSVEISGSPISFVALAEVIVTLCKSVPCVAHAAHEQAAQREAS
jgi:hypothetical protein